MMPLDFCHFCRDEDKLERKANIRLYWSDGPEDIRADLCFQHAGATVAFLAYHQGLVDGQRGPDWLAEEGQ